ncbi:Cyclic di-GMP phosphodiesterase Gmr [Enhygromyxa salina]|uniref:Cyclic di-GMP phosphodiesterase Gmr n=1 Tax=Enhygromyxa salina TaxID=215803 RepID=A0A2S9XDY1_9BACT|nr:GGDEF domain-containing phosphodiesterase [Enhygromyxa salina]PRP91063.1 Cyclic di-GMP phosphodiesterase Gmr [Enhygromyxa salina]
MTRDVDKRRGARVLVGADSKLAAQLVDALAQAPTWTFEVSVVHPTEVNFDRVDDDFEVYLVDASTLDPHVSHPDTSGRRPVIAVCDELETSLDRVRAAGAFDLLGPEDINPRTVERTIRHALEQAGANASLRNAKARHDLLLRAANDGLWEWNLDTDLVRYSSRWRQLFGLVDEDIGDSREAWFSRVHHDDLPGLRADIRAHIDGRSVIHQFEHRIRQRDGGFRWVLSRGLVHRDRWGRAVALAGSLTDINRRKRAEALAAPHALHDELTGLPSRRVLIERLDQAIAQTRRDPEFRFSVLFLNLDRFKVLNDSIGLDSADRILAQLAQRLRGCVADGTLVCRYGGDEFAILIEGHEEFAEADALAQTIHDNLRQPFELDEQTIFTTASIGITNSARNYERPAEVIRDAGVATSRAKRRGKSRSSTFDTAMRQEALNTLRTQMQLREAIVRQQFEVYYQPIVALGSCRLTGFEALVRWNHPKRGIIGPVEFIALAEETGLIVPIGQFVLREACSQMATWRRRYADAGDVSISINLSGHQLGSPTLVTDIEQVLEDTGLAASAVKLELTESTLIDDPTTATRILGRLRDRGIKLYIDDFGTGYSSLSYLHRFAIDGLKIDKSFVDMVGRDDRKAAIVPSIVGLAHNLGMGVVAEGVETPQQARELTLLDCAEAQGYLYSRPVPRDQAAALIERRILCDGDYMR